jgi:hypothetical protein
MAVKPLALDLCCGKGGWTIGLLKAGWDVVGVDVEHWEGYPSHFLKADIRKLTVKKIPGGWDLDDGYGNGYKGDFKLVVASPPCQEFSYSSFPFKKAREKFTKDNPPDRSIWDACVRIAKELNAPLILENVRGAEKWMGKAQRHYGSFYLWGDVPALLPIGCPRKGFQQAVKESRGKRGPLNAARVTEWRGNVQGKGKFGWNSAEVQNLRMNKGAFPGECERKTPVYRGPEMSAQRDKYKRLVNGSKLGGRGAAAVGRHKSNARKEWSAIAAMIPEELAVWIGECFYPKEVKN